MPSLGTQTDTPMAGGGVYIGSPGSRLNHFPDQGFDPEFFLCEAPSGRRGLGEMVECAPQVSGIEGVRKIVLV